MIAYGTPGLPDLDFPGSGGARGIVVQASPPAAIRGSLAIEGQAKDSLQRANVRLMPLDGGIRKPANASVDERGSFDLSNVSLGRYEVVLYRLPENGYVAGIALDGVESRRPEIEVASGAHTLRIRVGADGATVRGTVRSEGGPLEDATVLLAPDERGSYWLYRSARSTQDGEFSITGVPPGKYRLFAWAKVEPGIWGKPGSLEAVAPRATAVDARPGASIEVEVKAIPRR